jgi:hypothetical protein
MSRNVNFVSSKINSLAIYRLNFVSLKTRDMKKNDIKLRRILAANGSFSALSGISMILFAGSICEMFGVSSILVFRIIGAGLILFAGSVLINAFRKEIPVKQVKFIIVQDWLWVLGSAAILLLGAFDLTTLGYVCIAIVAVLIATFAVLQKIYLPKSRA